MEVLPKFSVVRGRCPSYTGFPHPRSGKPKQAHRPTSLKWIALAVVLNLLCGCPLMEPSKPDAVDLGGGRYSVTGTSLSANMGSARQAAAIRATSFCGSSSRQAVIESVADKAYGDAWGARTSCAIFYCK